MSFERNHDHSNDPPDDRGEGPGSSRTRGGESDNVHGFVGSAGAFLGSTGAGTAGNATGSDSVASNDEEADAAPSRER
jgi:hypothetical protein